MFHVLTCGSERHVRGPGPGAEEIAPGRNDPVEGPQHRLHTASQPVPLHRAAGPATDGERDSRVFERGIGGVQHPEDPAADSTTATKRGEIRAVAATVDQALSR